MKKLIMPLLLLFSTSSFAMNEEMMSSLVENRIESQLGINIIDVEFSSPEGVRANFAKLGSVFFNLAEFKVKHTIKEIHAKSSNNLEVNCSALFNNENESLVNLIDCNIWSNSRSHSPYDPVAGNRKL